LFGTSAGRRAGGIRPKRRSGSCWKACAARTESPSCAGAIRAQLARVYAKAKVSNNSQLISLFIEDLLDRPIRNVVVKAG
jgi:hypothetical protein